MALLTPVRDIKALQGNGLVAELMRLWRGASCGYTENDGLVFGGSVAARRILWKRTHGTLGIRKNVARESCYYGSYEAGDNAPILNSANTNYADYVVVRYKRCAATY